MEMKALPYFGRINGEVCNWMKNIIAISQQMRHLPLNVRRVVE